jgi:hypothetical protein
MSESPSPSDRTLAPLLAAGVQVAAVVAGWGFTSLLLDRDVIPDPAVGPLVGPIAVVVSGVVTVLGTRRAIASGRPWRSAIAAGAVALLAMLVVLAVGSALGHGDSAWLLLGASAAISAPFIPLAALLVVLSVVGGWGLSRAARHDPR